MNEEKLRQLERLLNEVIHASTNAEARRPLEYLNSEIRAVQHGMDPYLHGKLTQAAIYAKQASGKVKDKDHWAEEARTSWYVFESGLEHDERQKGESNT